MYIYTYIYNMNTAIRTPVGNIYEVWYPKPPTTQGVPAGRGNCYIHNRQVYCFFQQFNPAGGSFQPARPPDACVHMCMHASF